MPKWETSNSAYGQGVARPRLDDVSDDDDDGDFLGLGKQTQTAPTCGSRAEALRAVRESGDALLHLPQYKDDREIVMVAVRSHVDALLWAEPKLREDRDVVRAAVEAHGRALRYTSTLRDDPEIALAACREDGDALQFCKRLKDDKRTVLAAVAQSGFALQYASAALRDERDVVQAAVASSGPRVLKCASERLRADLAR